MLNNLLDSLSHINTCQAELMPFAILACLLRTVTRYMFLVGSTTAGLPWQAITGEGTEVQQVFAASAPITPSTLNHLRTVIVPAMKLGLDGGGIDHGHDSLVRGQRIRV